MKKDKIDFNNIPEFASVNEVVEWLPFLKIGGLRHLLHSNQEFRKKCAKQLGRKILLHIPSILEFIKDQPSEKDKYKRKPRE